ncbi:Gx transporter family protein [Clostridium aminobutyricum]|uniref:Gx transporter family protein n=1 Tax=Clostridium aminobutyricum TaxID=33953 RepID=A0A939IGF0_CLOAM|nr:Gx transporter family protein [Clostridium aminobutyricum]MBN7773200.1 Gx transporter family protein [Clostridium aminobutyricum]
MPYPTKHSAAAERTRKLATSAILASLGLIFSYIEAILPFSFGIPGIKLGIANLVVIIALYTLGRSYALSINVIRILVAGLLFNGLFGAMYSLAGALLSFAVMLLLKKTNRFSIVGVSMAGGVTHNVGQLLIAAAMISNLKIFFYFPVLLFSGMITGILIGIISHFILRRLRRFMQ